MRDALQRHLVRCFHPAREARAIYVLVRVGLHRANFVHRLVHVRGDVRDAHAVSAAARGMDAVCHLAFINGTEFFYEKPELVLEVGKPGKKPAFVDLAANGGGGAVKIVKGERRLDMVRLNLRSVPWENWNDIYNEVIDPLVKEAIGVHEGEKFLFGGDHR